MNNLEQVGRAANPVEILSLTFLPRVTQPTNVSLWILPTQCQPFNGATTFLPNAATDPLWRGGTVNGAPVAAAAHAFPNVTVYPGQQAVFNLNEVPDDFTLIQPEQSNFYYFFMWGGTQGLPYWYNDPGERISSLPVHARLHCNSAGSAPVAHAHHHPPRTASSYPIGAPIVGPLLPGGVGANDLQGGLLLETGYSYPAARTSPRPFQANANMNPYNPGTTIATGWLPQLRVTYQRMDAVGAPSATRFLALVMPSAVKFFPDA